MPLLQATLSPNTGVSTGGGDINVLDNNALVPDTGPTGGETLTYSTDQISQYVVRKGDTLSKIAQMFGVSVNTIVWGNDIKKGVISEGQVLVILPVSGVEHMVKAGDTLKSIAKKYGGDLNEMLSFNNLTLDSKLSPGDVIVVPDGEITPAPVPVSVGSAGSNPPRPEIKYYPNYDSYYIRPIIGGVKTQGIHGFNGVDLASSIGTPIMASASGEVIVSKSSGWNGGYGQYVVISHPNGTQTLYGHLSENEVYEGQAVKQGQVIGLMGSTGKSTGPHVHFEIRGAKNPF